MWRKLLFTGFLVSSVLILTLSLMLVGMQSMIELWQVAPQGQWLLPILAMPFVAGICAMVCYMFYSVLTDREEENDQLSEYFHTNEISKHLKR